MFGDNEKIINNHFVEADEMVARNGNGSQEKNMTTINKF